MLKVTVINIQQTSSSLLRIVSFMSLPVTNWICQLSITHSQAEILTAELPTVEAVDWKVWRRRRPPSLLITRTSR